MFPRREKSIMKTESTQSLQVLSMSAVLGFVLGAFGYACWQHAVEGAQVVAGIVRYPEPVSPFGLYQAHVWTILHQIPALFLHLGASEKALSVILSGLEGALSFSALSAGLFLVCRDRVFSCLLPFLIFFTKAYFFGLNYPVFMMGVNSTYGTIALFWFLLTTVMLSSGHSRTGGMLLGLLVSVHPGFAIVSIAAVFLAFLFLRPLEREEKKRFGVFFLAGLVLSSLSFLFHVTVTSPEFFQNLMFGMRPAKSLPVFVRIWDSHRQPIAWLSGGTLFIFLTLILSGVWLFFFRQECGRALRVLFSFFFAVNMLALGGIVFSHIAPEQIPSWLLALMPARLTSFGIVSYLITAFGLLRSARNSKAAVWSEFALILMLLLKRKLVLLLILPAVLALIFKFIKGPASSELLRKAALIPLFLLAFYFTGWEAFANGRENIGLLNDSTSDPLYAAAAQGSGYLLLAPGVSGMQLLTRRPVLLDPEALDVIPYVPEAAAPMETLLRDIYGVELFAPQARSAAMLNPQDSQERWESYSARDWRRIANQYGVTEVMVPGDWRLQINQRAENGNYRLYAIS